MFRILVKIFFIIVISLSILNCSKIKTVKISEDVIRFDRFNSKGNYQNSYYIKYNKTFSQWFRANCYNSICEYTNLAIIEINNLSKGNQKQSVNNQEQSVNNQEQSVNNQEQNFENPGIIEGPLENN